jgi:putative ABC transport system permease protein
MRRTLRRLWYVLRQRRFDADLAEEMAFHRQMAQHELAQQGAAPEDARLVAHRRFGSAALTHDRVRDVWIPAALRDVSHDLRFACRQLAKNPSFTLVAVVTLGLSIGFNTTLFTIVDGMAGGSPRIDLAKHVVAIDSLDPAGRTIGVSYPDFQDWLRVSRSFEGLAAHSVAPMNLTDTGLAAARVAGVYVSSPTFSLLRERPILGRDFGPDDDRAGGERVAIIAASLWKSRYNGDPAIIGRKITVNGAVVTVVGVMREGFRFPLVHDLWQPLASLPGLEGQARDSRGLRVFGRLASGVGLPQARAELTSIMSALSKTYPTTNANVRPKVEPFAGGFDLTNPWNAMLIAVGIVLLIACANIANLLLARATYRSNEIAIRTSLGASRWRIVRQLVIESGVLAVVAGMASVGVAVFGVRLWLASMPVADWPYWYDFTINTRVLSYLVGISLGSVLLFGVGPAWYISGCYPGEHLKDAAQRTTSGRRTRRWSNVLLGTQLALTLSLLAGAGLLARTLIAVYRADSIVDTSKVVLAGLGLPPQKYATPEQRIALYSHFEERISAVPSVEAATLASGAPFYNAPVRSVTLQGQAGTPATVSANTSYVLIGPRYFDTLGLRLIRGRAFTDLDGTPGHETVIVNQLFVSKFLPGIDPMGQRIRLIDPNKPDPDAPWLTIVGVSPSVREHYAQEFDPVVYVSYRLNPLAEMVLMTRATVDAAALTPTLREQFRQLDPDLPLLDIRPLDWLLSGTRFANQVFATLFGVAAGLGVLLAAIGLHAIIAHDVGRRTQEIGIRMALGAQPPQVAWLFVRRVLGPLAWGLAIGLGAAFGVGRFVRAMLIQTSPNDPLTLVTMSIVLILVALISASRPARSAARLDPARALRYE